MARILYWNINNFTNEKIAAVSKKQKRDDMEANAGARGPYHLGMILNTLGTIDPGTGLAVDLDFIVVVEIYARIGGPLEGHLIDGSGLTGCTNLLAQINANVVGAGNWSLVPPVVTGTLGQREAIAVYYRNDRWYFLGPGTWPAAYPPLLAAGLPVRVIPGAYPYRPGLAENLSAGQWFFPQAMPPGFMGMVPNVNFPGAVNRKPWLTCFGAFGAAANLLRIMALHTKPNEMWGPAYADQGTAAIADTFDMTTRPPDAANQTDVIVGDFNVDNLVAANFAAGGPFGRLTGVGVNPVAPPYSALVQPPVGLSPNDDSYYHTHGKTVSGEEPAQILEDTDVPPYWQRVGHYPGQEYSGLSIDNALVRYHAGMPPAHNTTILARARGTPYNAPPMPPVMPMLGHYQNGVWMNETINNIYALAANPANLSYDLNERFREWDNYGTVYSVSDHFALLFDV
jgi:hypothetical protein